MVSNTNSADSVKDVLDCKVAPFPIYRKNIAKLAAPLPYPCQRSLKATIDDGFLPSPSFGNGLLAAAASARGGCRTTRPHIKAFVDNLIPVPPFSARGYQGDWASGL
ncbi:hypothetical protein AGR3A_Cc20015 [Agrobacterium tomkonis CFBP 6623]|uniref:Uncharacterized protein n=1 Tax=Agrobacterium tomkonis CFBP 6623 TaxID=1183432 RepID=A0A1S7P2M8_9HYPH|nr:hypothetical protein [Agrobacterium sp. LC34]CUX15129.1 hypothetical protein AGR3A_Cc20015 [Agrobacterium tomkonis CFBP 6623]